MLQRRSCRPPRSSRALPLQSRFMCRRSTARTQPLRALRHRRSRADRRCVPPSRKARKPSARERKARKPSVRERKARKPSVRERKACTHWIARTCSQTRMHAQGRALVDPPHARKRFGLRSLSVWALFGSTPLHPSRRIIPPCMVFYPARYAPYGVLPGTVPRVTLHSRWCD
jgi:hypothetical protein